jgi:sec-independent protein translocase protein TatC
MGGRGLNPAPPAGMYLLKKVFQLRENAHPDHEKPFLEHLEDLRITVTRIVITLLISMLVCFTFQEKLMEVLRRPVERVWITQLEQKLPQDAKTAPKPLGVDLWEEAKAVERAAAGLPDKERATFYESLENDDLVFHARAAGLLRAVLALPEKQRDPFLEAVDLPPDLKLQVKALLVSAPSPEVDNRGNLKLMSALKPTETFMLSMKLSFFAGIVVSFPLLLLYILQFVLPGLHNNEKRVLWPSMLIGFGLFIAGVCFAYFVVLPRALDFFYNWSGKLGVSNDWRIGEYITFATQFTLLFGLSFELPVVVMVLVRLGLLSYETMSNTRSYAILAIFIIAALITPTPDAMTLILMALPMVILYELCIWLAWFDRRKNRRREEEEAREDEERRARRLASAESQPDVEDVEDVTEEGDSGWHEEHPHEADHPHDTDPDYSDYSEDPEDHGAPYGLTSDTSPSHLPQAGDAATEETSDGETSETPDGETSDEDLPDDPAEEDRPKDP